MFSKIRSSSFVANTFIVKRFMYRDFSYRNPRSCQKCIHYKPDLYEQILNIGYFREMDWGDAPRCRLLDNKEVLLCRKEEGLCGKEGRYYHERRPDDEAPKSAEPSRNTTGCVDGYTSLA